jgi:alpha-tubulin suppressor-like RCC1 family protein
VASGHGLALDTSGQIHEWCSPFSGQVAPTGTGFTAIAAGEESNLALDAAGAIHAWGTDMSGILTNVPSGSAFVAIALGSQSGVGSNSIPYGQTGVALQANGQIQAWGADHLGQVSNAPAGSDFSAISCKFMQCLALDSSGRIHGWGGDYQGAVSVPPIGTGFVAIATGLFDNGAIDATGQIYRWGADGILENYPTGNGYTAIAYGVLHGLGLDSTGTIYGWGNDLHGQVSNAPTQSGFSALDAGTWWSAALFPTIEPVPAIGPVGRLALTALVLGLGLAGMRADRKFKLRFPWVR